MKKKSVVKKVVSLVLGLVMVLGLAVPVGANDFPWLPYDATWAFIIEGDTATPVWISGEWHGHTGWEISNATVARHIAYLSEWWLAGADGVALFNFYAPAVHVTAPATITFLEEVSYFALWGFSRIDMIDPGGYDFYINHLPINDLRDRNTGLLINLVGYNVDDRHYAAGSTIVFNEPGIFSAFLDDIPVVFIVRDSGDTPSPPPTPTPTPTPAPTDTQTAVPSAHSVLVDGVPTAFRAFNIDGHNFFMLRDIAYVLNGTNSQFEVTWDGTRGAINLLTGEPYTPGGNEMAAGGGTAQTAIPSTAVIYVDGVRANLRAYTIGGNNFFRLRDLGDALGFGVDWDNAAASVLISSSS